MRALSRTGTGMNIRPFNGKSLFDVGRDASKSFSVETCAGIFHYCRALAMEAEIFANNQEYEQAIAVSQKMKLLYDPVLHSASIARVSICGSSALVPIDAHHFSL